MNHDIKTGDRVYSDLRGYGTVSSVRPPVEDWQGAVFVIRFDGNDRDSWMHEDNVVKVPESK